LSPVPPRFIRRLCAVDCGQNIGDGEQAKYFVATLESQQFGTTMACTKKEPEQKMERGREHRRSERKVLFSYLKK